ncbi:hypothetical protein [Gordonia desulfuricans]|uniref:hypothetical protein n=1 Tax=Gordonia desulfuricans TaxID=89051 RepID=UPI000A7F0804|nr:hypothetical protein [Gordonia desulfuricans]
MGPEYSRASSPDQIGAGVGGAPSARAGVSMPTSVPVTAAAIAAAAMRFRWCVVRASSYVRHYR